MINIRFNATRTFSALVATLSMSVAGVSCSVATEGSEQPESLAEAGEQLVGSDTFLYLRCNSTGWQPVAANRFRSTAAPGFFELTFDVTQPWMVSSGDQCALTETNAVDGWGTSQQNYTTRLSPLVVPGASQVVASSNTFTVKYPSVGRYTAKANWVQGVLVIEPAANDLKWLPKASAEVSSIARSPLLNDVYWVTFDDGTVYRTGNGSSATPTWNQVNTWTNAGGTSSLPSGTIRDISILPVIGDRAVVGFAGTLQGSKLWVSAPGGASWTQITNFPQGSVGEILGVSTSPLDSRIYVTGLSGTVSGSVSGSSWTSATTADPLQPAAALGTVTSVAASNTSANQLWVGTSQGEVFLTFDRAQTWLRVGAGQGLPAAPVVDITVNSALSPPEVYVTFKGLQTPDRVFRSSNGGQTWLNVHGNLPTNAAPPSIYSIGSISVNPADNNVIYATFTFEEARSTNRGASWLD